MEDLQSGNPSFFSNVIDFTAAIDETQLTEGGAEVLADGNLGGSSIWSEVFAFEVLHRCERAELLKTEAEIIYDDSDGKKTDLLLSIESLKIGVSVTRAFGWPPEDPYTLEQATTLLNDKLTDISLSSDNVWEDDAWEKQILHIMAYTPEHAATVEDAWKDLEPSIKLNTVVFVTATEGEDDFMY